MIQAPEIFTTPRLILRRSCLEDAEAIFEYASDPQVIHYMDFPANTRNQRAWFKDIFLTEGIPHRLIYLEVDDKTCIEQIIKRRESNPERSAVGGSASLSQFDTEEVFHHVTSFFQPPSTDEGFSIEVVKR